MKIAYASTVEQEEEIDRLIMNLRSNVLSQYISREELDRYEEMGLLEFEPKRNLYNGTLREAYQLMTALQTVTDLIGSVANNDGGLEEKYYQMYARNVEKINYYGLFFPFDLQFFHRDKEGVILNQPIIHELLM